MSAMKDLAIEMMDIGRADSQAEALGEPTTGISATVAKLGLSPGDPLVKQLSLLYWEGFCEAMDESPT